MSWWSSIANHTSTRFSPWSRTRVDLAQTSFWEGREFRTFREFSLSAGVPQVIKAVVPINIVLMELSLVLVDGDVTVATKVGGTEGGSYSTSLPIFAANNMVASSMADDNRRANYGAGGTFGYYQPTVLLSTGGIHTGGTTLDVLRGKTSGNSNFASSVGLTQGSERGVSAGTYYFALSSPVAAAGVFKARWEERP